MPIIAAEKIPEMLKYIDDKVQARPAREHRLGRSLTKDRIVGGGGC